MRIFSGQKVDEIRRKRDMSFGDFMRAMIRVAPKYGTKGIKPANNHIHDIMSGKVLDPKSSYLCLFADVLECKVDDFFVKKEPAKEKT